MRRRKPVGQSNWNPVKLIRRKESPQTDLPVVFGCAFSIIRESTSRAMGWSDQDGTRSLLRMRQNGTIKFFNQAKGYGFVSPEGGGKDVFVHVTAVQRSGIPELAEGMRISFEVQPDKRGRGPQAVNLQLI
jgi:cold shock protein